MKNIPGSGHSRAKALGQGRVEHVGGGGPCGCSRVREGERRRREGQGGNRESHTGPCGLLPRAFTPPPEEGAQEG